MASFWFCASILLSYFTLLCNVASLEIGIGGGGIIIGGGGGGGGSPPSQAPGECPPPPPPPCPPPPKPKAQPSTPSPLNRFLRRDLATILAFKKEILKDPKAGNDPLNITANWVPNGNPCNFKGFNCAMNPLYKMQTLSDVQFNGFKLRAPLNNFIEKLLEVSIFHANSNRFHGGVPQITSTTLPFLFELDLSNNQLTGDFPSQVLAATNLTFLDLRFNSFQRATLIPPAVFKLDVDVLFINNNHFPPQELPLELGFTPALYLTLANNNFTGPIPYTIGEARKTLLEVLFLNNKLSGCLPWQIGLLKLARVFDASVNYLRGPIPSSFACLENMQIFNLRSNKLDGVVPEMLCALPKLSNLTLSDNYFTEVGPRCRALIKKGVLDVSNNCISGLYEQRQRPPLECDRFFSSHPIQCPNPYLHAPCPAATYANRNGGAPPGHSHLHHHRRTAEEGPVLSATYGALNPV